MTYPKTACASDRGNIKSPNMPHPTGRRNSAVQRGVQDCGWLRRWMKRRSILTRDEAPITEHGAFAAAAAAYSAGFRDDDVATITMIAGRESRWRSDAVNPHTSDRGMWQINWKTVQGKGFDELRVQLGITSDTDLLDLDTNAAVAFFMYADSVRSGEPWFPWRGSDAGHDGSGPGWDPKGSHTWHTNEFAADAGTAATAVLEGGGTLDPPDKPSGPDEPTKPAAGSYTIGPTDSDGFIAVVGRCVGITDAPRALRFTAAEAVADHNAVTLENVWNPGETVTFPAQIDGVRSYSVKAGDGMIAIAKGLGLGGSAAAQKTVAAINAWQGATPHPGAIWYGGAT